MTLRDYREHLDEVLKDPDSTAAYLNAALEDGTIVATAIQDIYRARDNYISSDFYCSQIAVEFRLVAMALERMGLKMRVEKL